MKSRQIIRYKNKEVDDVVIDGDLFRLEQMDDSCWWVAIYRGKGNQTKRVSFLLSLKGKKIIAKLQDDELGCGKV